ncbi:hypothetical protein ACG04R_23930 [Roseateles sp. BYS78W]|uniref:Uncharacterized protein n=1 Tax=Pelomonas candidula TaxID=3299025 RepID=A0ABW7HIT7_9BURK
MGPIALFDKSLLQSLSLDESVWFDHFFVPVVCPLFFGEILADLAKEMKEGRTRTAEDKVRVIADKTPVLSGAPCVHHGDLCIGSLLGQYAPHLGQVPLAGGRPVRNPDGKPGVVFQNSPEDVGSRCLSSSSDWHRQMCRIQAHPGNLTPLPNAARHIRSPTMHSDQDA